MPNSTGGMMRRLLPALFLLFALPATAALKWNDTLRDVYVNGALTRDGQTLVNEHRLAYLPPSGDAWIFDRDAHEVATADRTVFTFNDDRTSATTPDTFPTRHAAAAALPDESSWLATVGATTVLIYPHQRSEEHTSELQSRGHLVCRLLLEKKK